MKVLLINNFHYFKGGSETVYFNTAEILRKNGHEVVFFSIKNDKNVDCEQKHYFASSNKGVFSKFKGLINYFYNVDAKRKLERLITAEKPDIAHVHLFWGGISPSIFGVLKKHQIPLIHTVHDYRMVCPNYTFKRYNGSICEQCGRYKYYRCLLNRCSKGSLIQSIIMTVEMYLRNIFFNPARNIDGFIFVSQFSKDKHIQYNKSFLTASSIVLHNFSPYADQTLSGSKRTNFLYFGRISHEKGVYTLINAFLRTEHTKLLVVGTGEEEDQLKDIVRQSGCDNIEFAGYKCGLELRSIIENAYFVIVPSEWYENNPMSIIEAYSLGIPVIGSRIGGIPEIINDGKTGWLYTHGDEDDLRKCIIKASHISETDYTKMRDNAKQFAIRHFSIENHYLTLIDYYRKTISDSRYR